MAVECPVPQPRTQLRAARVLLGRKQRDVAAYLGCSQSTYWHIEAGTSEPTPETRAALARYFGIPEDVLFGPPPRTSSEIRVFARRVMRTRRRPR